MQLSFLGNKYDANLNAVATEPSNVTASFMGNRYQVRRPRPASATTQLGLRKYRGVTY